MMKITKTSLALIIAAFQIQTLYAAQTTQRPTIGLVLGGGGARGAAHIGVIQKLEELKIPVDCVAGTSMGGLVAGAYSTGMSAQQMGQALAQANWRDMFDDSPPYTEFTKRNKEISQTFIPGTEAGIKNGKLRFPSAVLSGQKIKFFINRMIQADKSPQLIDQQPLPVALIATDIVNGERVVYRQGDLATVMRATMSVPGLIAPVKYEGRTLVDGGLVDNVPIQEVKDLCRPDVVIAVNVGSPLLNEEEIESSPLSVTIQTINLLTEQNVSKSLALLNKEVDIYIKPDLDGITAADFEKNSDAVQRGYAAASRVQAQLQALSATPEQYLAWQHRHQRFIATNPIIDHIDVADHQSPSGSDVQNHISQPIQKPFDAKALENDLLNLYGNGQYVSMDYQLINQHDRTSLRILPILKPWGPNYLRTGLNMSWGNSDDADYNLRLGYQMTQLNTLGGELLTSGQLGSSNRALLNYYQPIDKQQLLFTEFSGQYVGEKNDLYQNGKAQSTYRIDVTQADAGIGLNLHRYGTLKMGVLQRWQNANLEVGTSDITANSAIDNVHGWYSEFNFDRMNRLYFPTSGWLARGQYFNASSYSKISTELQAAHSIGDFVFTGKLSYVDSPKGVLPLSDSAFMGGVNNVSGLANRQIIGDRMHYAGLRAERIVSQMPLGIRGDLRIGISAEMAKMKLRYSEQQDNGWVKSGAVYLGGETPIGPIFIGVSKANHTSPRIYLFLGSF